MVNHSDSQCYATAIFKFRSENKLPCQQQHINESVHTVACSLTVQMDQLQSFDEFVRRQLAIAHSHVNFND